MFRKALYLLPLLLATPVWAHSPYLKPNQFQPAPARNHITVEASFSEDELRPDVAMTSDSFHATAPDGSQLPLTPAASLKDATFLEVPLTQTGTYRISSGPRQGRIAKAAVQGQNVRFLEPGDKPWPSETLVDVQSLTRADVFITHGKASALPAPENDLELYPVSHPTDAYTQETVRVRVLDKGQPVAGAHVTVHPDAQRYADNKAAPLDLVSDANGEVSFMPKTAGLYLLQTRLRAPSADKADLWISRTATLTLEVLPE